ncbi:MAG: two-component regulator propeller domain-containing protein [bacterium]
MVRFLTHTSLIILFSLFLSKANLSQIKNLKFEHITAEDGLAQNYVSVIYQDSEGYMWFGTMEGLTRYDGYQYINYSHDQYNPNSLSDNLINAIYETEDSGEKILWIATSMGGLNKFYSDKERFAHYKGNTSNPKNINTNYISSICGGDDGIIWIGTAVGLFEMNLNYEIFTPFLIEDIDGRDGGIIKRIVSYKNQKFLVVNTVKGIYSFDIKSKKYSKLFSLKKAVIKDDVIKDCILEPGNDDVIWVGTKRNGLIRYDMSTGEVKNFWHNDKDAGSISDNFISALFIDEDSNLWVGYEHFGLSILNTEDWMTGKFSHYQHNANDKNSISNNSIFSITQDKSGVVWIGTNGGGVNKCNLHAIQFSHIQNNPTNANSLLDNNIWSIYQTKNKDKRILWLGSNLGLTRIERHTGEYVRYQNDPADPSSILPQSVRSIVQDSQGNLWIGNLDSGLSLLNQKTGVFNHYLRNRKKKTGMYSDEIYKIFEDADKNLWIASNNGGLEKFDYSKSEFTRIILAAGSDTSNWATTLYQDKAKTIWLGSWNYGLFGLPNDGSGKIFQFKNDPDDRSSISHNIVFAIQESKRVPGMLWIGTFGGGLNKFDVARKKFYTYTTKQGLCNNFIYAILEDEQGLLWISTNKGLSRFDPLTGVFKNYDTGDGLANIEFNLGAAYKSEEGELFFGGCNGVDHFYPGDFLNTIPPSVVLTGFKKFGQRVDTDVPIKSMKEIQLAYYENFIGFEFVALHYTNPKRNSYACKLENFDKDWNFIHSKGEIAYTNIPPGEYIFKIKAANSHGFWSPVKSIVVIIHPPFSKTWWFVAIVVVSGILVLFGIYKIRLKQIVKLNRVKTEERLKVQKKIATDFHDELGHRITSIVYKAKNIEAKIENNGEVKKELDCIINNASLLNEEMRQVVWEMDPQKESLFELLVNLKRFYDQLFDQDEIGFEIIGLSDEFNSIILTMEWRQNLSRIFKEALHNIKKHVKNCSEINLLVKVTGKELNISLINNGDGFAKDQVTNGQGLKNMKERAVGLGGKLEIFSERGENTEVSFSGILP